MKKIILILLVLFSVPVYADCNKKGLDYANCNAGQLVDICKGFAYWKNKIDCCDKNSNYNISKEKIDSKDTKEFYKKYITKFDNKVYHCALKTGIIDK